MLLHLNNARVTDAKEVGVGNPAEETFYHPDTLNIAKLRATVKGCFSVFCNQSVTAGRSAEHCSAGREVVAWGSRAMLCAPPSLTRCRFCGDPT